MTRSKSLIFLFLVCISRLNAQSDNDNTPNTLAKSVNIGAITFCKDMDYQFKVEANLYFEDSKVYICPRNLPINVTVVDFLPPNTPITYVTAWSINGIYTPSSVNHTLKLNEGDFASNDAASLECTFTANGGLQKTLNININKKMKLMWENSGGTFAFDENTEANYPFYEPQITPWAFIETNKGRALEAKANPEKGFYAVHDITPSNLDLEINPNMLLAKAQSVTLNYKSGVPALIDVVGCSDAHPELKVFTQTPKNFTMEVYNLCESDDDIQVVMPGQMVANEKDIIISPGLDGTVDRLKTRSKWIMGDDYLWVDPATGLVYVVAGPNLMAETPILPNSVHCPGPPSYNITPDEQMLNLIFGTVSVNAICIVKPDLIVNFDLWDDDDTFAQNEQMAFSTYRLNSGFLGDNFTEVYIVKDLGKEVTPSGNLITTLGRASGEFANTLALDWLDAVPTTLAHEVGHAKYGLIHPEQQFNKKEYKNNFMYGISNGRIDKIHRYQFHLINKD